MRAQRAPLRDRRGRPFVRRGLFVLLALLLIASVGFYLSEPGRRCVAALEEGLDAFLKQTGFRLESILVEGRVHIERETLLKVIGLKIGDPMTAVDPERILQKLKSLPWVAGASVERHLPDQVIIRLIERKPLVRWQHEGLIELAAEDGTPIATGDLAPYADLLLVVGKGANHAAPELVSQLAQCPDVAERVESAVRVADRRWDLHLTDGIMVRLPASHQEKTLKKFEELLKSKEIIDQSISVLDFRLPGRFIVRYKDQQVGKNKGS